MEATPEAYVARLVALFALLRPALRDDGTVFLNLGDSYAGAGASNHHNMKSHGDKGRVADGDGSAGRGAVDGLKPKDLCGIPWRVAFALQADGWYLRQDIIWHKPNPMPGSVTDRCTKAHEYVFLLSKRPTYYCDMEAIKEPAAWERWGDQTVKKEQQGTASWITDNATEDIVRDSRNKRSVWTVATQPFAAAHFATFPPALITPCILAGCPDRVCPKCGAPWERVVEHTPMEFRQSERGATKRAAGLATTLNGTCTKPATHTTTGFKPTCDHGKEPIPGTVLDPFMGSGTTAQVARSLGRKAIGFELNAEYIEIAAKERLAQGVLL